MEFYLLLTAFTLIWAGLTTAVLVRTRELGFLLGFLLLFYFSLYGAWFVVYNAQGGNVNARYFYLFNRLVNVRLDSSYLETIALYGIFVVLVQGVVLLRTWSAPAQDSAQPPLLVNLRWIPILSLFALGGAAYLIRDGISIALQTNSSVYTAVHSTMPQRYGAPQFYTLHCMLNRLAVIGPFFSLVVLLGGNKGRLFAAPRKWISLVGSISAAAAASGYLFLIGNKNELLFILIASFLLALRNSPRNFRLPIYGVAALIFLFISSIDAFRSLNLSTLSLGFSDKQFVSESAKSFTTSTEAFAAHFSLYAALVLEVPLTYGQSILSLISAVVPKIFWKDRPETVYEHYVAHIHAASGQGYTIHHATGWYLNFGILGVVVGAILLGALWSFFYNRHLLASRSNTLLGRVFFSLALFFFVAGLPGLLRAGIEGYKGLLVDSFLLPLLLIGPFVAIRKIPLSEAPPIGRAKLSKKSCESPLLLLPEAEATKRYSLGSRFGS